MEFWDAVGVAFVTCFWVGVEVYLLLHPYFAEGLAYTLRVSPDELEVAVFFIGVVASWWAEREAERR